MKIPVKYGLILATISIAWTLLEILLANVFGLFKISTITSFLSLIIPATVLTLAFNKQKKTTSFFQMNEALKTGLVISLIGSFIFALFLFLLYTIFPQVIDPYLNFIKEQLNSSQTNPEEIEKTIITIKNQFSPINQAFYSFISLLVTGLALSWVIGKILRKKIEHTEISATPSN